jgi:hypothetical protein
MGMTAVALTGREYRMTPEGQADLIRSMKPFIDQANEARERVRAICAPVLEMHARMRESLAPVIAAREKMMESITRATSVSSSFGPSESVLPREIFIHRQPVAETGIGREEMERIIDRAVARALEGAGPAQKTQTSYLLPAGSAWEKLQIKFVDGHTVKVRYPGMRTDSFNFKDLGFQNDKTNNPDTRWEFLRQLASNGGSLPVSKFDSRFNRQAKYELSGRLKTFFGMSEDPFYRYKAGAGYSIKFVLRSDTDSMDEEDFSETSFDA